MLLGPAPRVGAVVPQLQELAPERDQSHALGDLLLALGQLLADLRDRRVQVAQDLERLKLPRQRPEVRPLVLLEQRQRLDRVALEEPAGGGRRDRDPVDQRARRGQALPAARPHRDRQRDRRTPARRRAGSRSRQSPWFGVLPRPAQGRVDLLGRRDRTCSAGRPRGCGPPRRGGRANPTSRARTGGGDADDRGVASAGRGLGDAPHALEHVLLGPGRLEAQAAARRPRRGDAQPARTPPSAAPDPAARAPPPRRTRAARQAFHEQGSSTPSKTGAAM